ncbi:hypothetical protein [Faecalimonas umbilicata]|uniref:hypothetical protein n=1 Tax=Faecalimonas umbilicata TaxID=1912855 RepID=UPI00399449D9
MNYLREHVADDVRIHYTYTNTDGPANIVPDFASTNYFIRSSKRSRTEDASNRVDDCAKGAALMTGTRVEIELVTSNQEMKVNRPLAEAFYQAMTETSLPEYTKEELQFAETITKEAGLINDGNYLRSGTVGRPTCFAGDRNGCVGSQSYRADCDAQCCYDV